MRVQRGCKAGSKRVQSEDKAVHAITIVQVLFNGAKMGANT